MSQLAVESGLFDYLDVPEDDRGWLMEQEENIVNYCRRTVADHIRAGEVLLAVQKRVHGHFRKWLTERTPLSRSTAYSLMDVALQFKEMVERLSAERTTPGRAIDIGKTGLIEVKALYTLSQSRVPPIARERALLMACDDNRPVTLQDARAIIAAESKRQANYRGKQKTLFDKGYEKARAELFKDECRAEPPSESREARAFRLFESLARDTVSLRFEAIEDAEDTEEVQYTGAAIFKRDGVPSRRATRSGLLDVIESLAGHEEKKVCPACKAKLLAQGVSEAEAEQRSMRPLNWFTANRSKSDGLASECRSCSRPRIKAAKLRKRAQQQPVQAA